MTDSSLPSTGTSKVNGALWGAEARTWAELQEQTALPLYEHALAATKVGAGTRYLDVGCGSGMAAQRAASRHASVSGLDASEALLAIARTRVPAPVGDFRLGDLEMLPFADAAFDVVTGFNSFQYAASPVAALREARRVLKPGGFVVIATWAPADRTKASALLAALRPLMPPPPPAPPNTTGPPPGPFALSDESALRGLAESAGLKPVTICDVECPFVYPDLATGVRALGSSGVAARAIANSSKEAVHAAHKAALLPFVHDGKIKVDNAFRYLIATS